MAQYVKTTIDIDGQNIKQFTAFSLSQTIFDHHTFRLICPTEAIDGTSGKVFNASKEMIGGNISVKIDAVDLDGGFQFAGVVTQVETSRHSGHAGDIIISGYSPTVLMDQGPHCQTWEESTLASISNQVLQNFPQNLLQPKVSPSFSDSRIYTVQYNETGWQFLCRLTATHGEWFFYDGQKLVMGSPDGEKVNLSFGQTLNSFDMAMQVRPANFEAMAWDYTNTEVYDSTPSGIAGKAGLSELGKHALDKSESFFGTQPKLWNNSFLKAKNELDEFVTVKAATQSSNMIRFQGNSGQPAVQVGSTVSVQGKNVFSQQDESFGDFTVISVNHHVDGQGNYSNDFSSVPASLTMPPVSAPVQPRAETQSAIVTDNNDPEGMGRIRVQFHWMDGSENSPWTRIANPHAGDNKGMFILPEIGEEVIVGFEGGDPTKPFVIGMLYNSNAKPGFDTNGNNLKVLKTRSGNQLVMNDDEGSVHIADKGGNDIKIDGGGNISVTAAESIVLTCGQAKLEMKKDGTININGKEITIEGTDKATLKSGQASFAADGQQNNADMAGMKSTVSGIQETDIKGLKTVISGDVEVDISANAQVQISGSAMVAVKGAVIMLN